MKLIICDYEKDREYKFKDVSDEDLEYCIKCYKQIYRRKEIKETRKERVEYQMLNLRFWAYLFLFSCASMIAEYQDISDSNSDKQLLENNDNLFDDNEIVIDKDMVEDICETLEKQLGVTIDEEYKDEYLLLEAVNRNENLTKEEKEFCYKYIDLFIDNPYLNKEEVYNALLNIDISYVERPADTDPKVAGVHIGSTNDINIYDNDSDKMVLAHELVHCVYHNNSTCLLPRFFREGMTELLTNEYFQENPFYEVRCYPFEIVAVKMLCEVTSPEAVLKAFTYGDMDYVIDEMENYLGDRKAACEAIDVLDVIIDEYLDEKDLSYTNREIYEKCLLKFRACINYKIDKEISDGFSYYYNEILFTNICYGNESLHSYAVDLEFFDVDSKAYFSKKLIENLDNEPAKTLVK